jgi:hypothetical protein
VDGPKNLNHILNARLIAITGFLLKLPRPYLRKGANCSSVILFNATPMKYLLLLSTVIIVCTSCKKEPEDPIIVPEPTPTIITFQGQIGENDNSTIAAFDNSLLICATSGSDISLLKISTTGSPIWRKDFDAGHGSCASALTETSNHDIFICGTTARNDHQTKSDILLIKTNSSGDTLWTKSYDGSEEENGFYIMTTDDGNLLLCGTSDKGYESSRDIFIVKVNMDGDILWRRTYNLPGQEEPYHILQTQQNNYLVTGSNGDTTDIRRLYFLLVDDYGTPLWNKTIGSELGNRGYSTAELSNGELITCGSIIKDGYAQILLLKTDADGNEIWQRNYGESYASDFGKAIHVNADGTFVITGGSTNEHTGHDDIVLLHASAQGEQLCRTDFGNALNEYGQNIVQDTSGDYLITGEYFGKIFFTRIGDNCVFK